MKTPVLALGIVLVVSVAEAVIRRDPPGVNVNASGATTVLITFGGLADQFPVEAQWCGSLVSAAPDIGDRCAPGSILGSLPLRFDQSRLLGSVFTDVMTIPPSVSRRAYEAAQRGDDGVFFYVRRFRSRSGGPDEYVAVTCRLSGGGARVPFALLDVKLSFAGGGDVMTVVEPGSRPPKVQAEIAFNGTGRLVGRWEVVQPGEALPSSRDLLPEAALPPAERAQQRRYTQVGRINVFLPPVGHHSLPGPEVEKLPASIEGQHMLLLRVEATDDREGDSDLSAAGAGQGTLHSGGVAGFALPVLRYYVGHAGSVAAVESTADLDLLTPLQGAVIPAGKEVDFTGRAGWCRSCSGSRSRTWRAPGCWPRWWSRGCSATERRSGCGERAATATCAGAWSGSPPEARPWPRAPGGSCATRSPEGARGSTC